LLTVVLGFLYLHGFLLCKIVILVNWLGCWGLKKVKDVTPSQ